MSDELTRMALTGLEPELVMRIKVRCEEVIRQFSGAPEDVPEYKDAQRILAIIWSME